MYRPGDVPTDDRIEARALRWLAVALSLSVLLNVAIAAGLIARGETPSETLEAVGAAMGTALVDEVPGSDSWWAMLEAYQLKLREPGADLYRVFFVDQIKFQYPPSSLLVLDLLPRSAIMYEEENEDAALEEFSRSFIMWPSRIACLLAVICAALLVERGLRRLAPNAREPRSSRITRFCLSIALGLTFYPLLKSHALGQVQVFLNGFVALALLLLLCEAPVASAVLLGVCCLIKPQYSVVVLAALLWRNWRFAGAFAGTVALGTCASLARYGLADHLRYLDVLRALSRQGETFWPNQSMNGLLNRFLGNGDAVEFQHDAFPPYIAGVYLASVASALGLFLLALGPELRRRVASLDLPYAQALTTALVLAAATMGSPVAWEHHYGTFLAFFALALPLVLRVQPFGRWTAPLLALSYLASANVMLRPEILFENRWRGLLGSHLFFGGLLLFALLFFARRRWTAEPEEPRLAHPADAASLGTT